MDPLPARIRHTLSQPAYPGALVGFTPSRLSFRADTLRQLREHGCATRVSLPPPLRRSPGSSGAPSAPAAV